MLSFKNNSLLAARLLNLIAAAGVVAMMLLTCADVVMRLFRKPIPGTYEIISFLGVVTASFAMAYTTAEKGHVAVDLVVRLFPLKIQQMLESLIAILGIILFALISWQSVLYGMNYQKTGEVSMTLKLPFYPVIYGVAFSAAVVCLVLFVDFINAATKLKPS